MGQTGDEIPLAGRIITIVDAFDAMVHDRPYKSAWSIDRNLVEIEKQKGAQFDPWLVDAFLEMKDAGALSSD
jgi:putative two-component system response regulator